MKKPEMILFDYGQTLVNEQNFDGVKGAAAVLKYAVKNKYNKTPEEIQETANTINKQLERFDTRRRHLHQVEIPNYMFTRYLYESQGIELSIDPETVDRVFWDAASPGTPTDGIEEFLNFLKLSNIRTGVISNISYCPQAVKDRINTCIPENEFEFIIATSEYMYRKPQKEIFELALEKAEVAAKDTWYIGDNYECDIEGARNAGIFPVWYIGAANITKQAGKETLTVKSWQELKNMLTNPNYSSRMNV